MASAKKKEKPENAVVPITQNPTALSVAVKGWKVLKQVTVPTFKIKDGETLAFICGGPIREGSKPLAKDGTPALDDEGNAKKPVKIMSVTRLDTGEDGQIVLGSVLAAQFGEYYPGDTYVGKAFALQKVGLKEGKRYKEYRVVELQKDE